MEDGFLLNFNKYGRFGILFGENGRGEGYFNKFSEIPLKSTGRTGPGRVGAVLILGRS